MNISGLKPEDDLALEKLKRDLNILDVDDNVMRLRSDFYLFQWLRANGMNVDKTKIILDKAYKWRKENRIFIPIQSFPEEMRTQFPMMDAVSKQGFPVIIITLDDWDIKLAVDKGQRDHLERYIYLRFLIGEIEWIEKNEKLIQQYGSRFMYEPEMVHVISNAHNLHLAKFAHPKAIQTLIEGLKCLTVNFPWPAIDAIFINLSTLHYAVLKLIRPFIKAKVQVFNCDQENWGKVLEEFLDFTQIDINIFGGKNPDSIK